MSASLPPLKWICFDSTFFDSAKTKIIRAMPEGDKLLLAWIGLLCLAAKMGGTGMIVLARNIPLSPERLAILLGESPPVIRLALDTFVQLGMVEIVEDDSLRIVEWDEHQHTEGLQRSRERKRLRDQRYRERQRKELPAASADSPTGVDPFAEYDGVVAATWRPAYGALKATGKLPALTVAHIIMVGREYPRAKLDKTFVEIATEARGVVGAISATLPWLRKSVGALERRMEQRELDRSEQSPEHKF